MRKLTLTLCFLLLASSAQALVTDWPHNETNGIGCTDCHSYSLWWQFSPVDGDPEIRAEKTNSICTGCHSEGGSSFSVMAHSDVGMGAFHNESLGEWDRACTDCHDPHFQAQLNWYGDASVANDELFLVQGTVSNITDNGDNTTTINYANLVTSANGYWDDNVTDWTRKSGSTNRGLLLSVPVTEPAGIDPSIFEITSVDEVAGSVTVSGAIDPANEAATFGLLYGQLIRDSVVGPEGEHNVKFFDSYGGFVDEVNNDGICQVCHTQTNHFLYNSSSVGTDHIAKSGDKGNSGKDSHCTYCHSHKRGFAPASDGGQHEIHLAMEGIECNFCHTNGTPDPETEVGCNICHNDGKAFDNDLSGTEWEHYIVDAVGNRYGLPNDTLYRTKWDGTDTAYSLNCNSCHNGRLNLEDVDDTNYTHVPGDTACDTCHDGTIQGVVGMQGVDDGHTRLASSMWIRQYDCFFCHVDTVGENYTFLSKHANQQLNVDIKNPQWAVTGQTAPYYTYDNPQGEEAAKTCYNVYCHTDGTTLAPEMRPYPWNGGHQDCNACHGHAQAQECENCHNDGRGWDDYPEKKWLSAMPMYANTGPGTDKANSHYRHLFTGFSCDDCHMDTIAGGNCLECHDTTIPTGSMNENQHINPQYHVNRSKNVVFKDGGTYNPTNKSCDNTACHTGYEPEWGGSVYDSIVCRKCHGVTDVDVDDFGKFNGARAKINLNQWAGNGHGRQGTVDPETFESDNPYPSGNPPANFPDNGCWYCHDSRVLHQDEERPFRLIQHEHFEQRFEKECVFCHMVAEQGDSSECVACHNADESLAPQLNNVPSLHAQNGDMTVCSDCHFETMAPSPTLDHVSCTTSECHTVTPEMWSSPDHRDYNSSGYVGAPGNTSCDTAECHDNDASRHNTEAGEWTQDQKDDVKNAYLQMGVCLKCHDDDSGDQCNSCHTGSQYDLGFDPADFDASLSGKTAGRIVPKKAKASSFHFGYKHFNAFAESSSVEAEPLDFGSVNSVSTSTREVIDTTKGWEPDQFAGRRVTITSGLNDGLTRPIVRNTINTLTVAPPFPDGQQLQANDNYQIMDHVWKGGKFCWDCHDPHGDDNIYMVQNEVATRTDGVVGKPITRKAVSFIRKTTGTDYVDLVADQETGEFNGICNVCHTDTSMHYTATSGNGHNSSRVCTECHEHRFTNSHASGESCNSCHRARPVPRHTAFGQARDCTKCHKDAINGRMNIMAQFTANSRHVQGVKVTNKHCYACHWESTPEGVMDLEKHEGYNYKTHVSVKDAEVDLVIWGEGTRPTTFDADGLGDDDTAVTFLAKDIDVWSSGTTSTLVKQRAQVDNVTKHCLGCHSDQNNDTQPFNVVDPENGDCKTPRQYAWDRSSIGSRYSDSSTTSFGKYSGPNVSEKDSVTKAFSAHGNAVAGGGGWSATDGEDQNITDSRDGAYNIQCFDCHSSHGSMVEGTTSSYTTFNGTKNGANLKETQAGKGGYAMTYKATANPNPTTINPYQAGAGQCFDCHDTPNSNTQISVSSYTPWGFTDTFGADSPIRGYRDSERFGEGSRGVNDRFAFKPTALSGGHFKASHNNIASPNYDPSGNSDLTTMGTIDGLCSPCHDPHGISRSLGADGQYATPLLKGTWMTSPYKEDSPTEIDDGYNGQDYYYGRRNYISSSYPKPPQQRADGRAAGAWRTDRNTFNQGDLSERHSYPAVYDRVGEEAQQFAGLCLRCHSKSSLTTDIDPQDSGTNTENLTWKSKDRIHRSVKGWGWNEGEDAREHSFTCSKCHSAHISGLPRLMKTNCLNFAHRGQQASGANPGSSTNRFGKFPYGWWDAGTIENYSTATCHGADTANGSSGWPANQSWNDVTPWEGQ